MNSTDQAGLCQDHSSLCFVVSSISSCSSIKHHHRPCRLHLLYLAQRPDLQSCPAQNGQSVFQFRLAAFKVAGRVPQVQTQLRPGEAGGRNSKQARKQASAGTSEVSQALRRPLSTVHRCMLRNCLYVQFCRRACSASRSTSRSTNAVHVRRRQWSFLATDSAHWRPFSPSAMLT